MERPTLLSLVTALILFATISTPAGAWGSAGHQVVALVADHYLKPEVRQKIATILATDTSGLTPTTGMADEASWADRFRESDSKTTKVRYNLTSEWHYVDIELDRSATLDAACFGHPAPFPKASEGPAQSCVVDRINAFVAELKDPATDPAERLVALQFVLHLVGDLHQPLHASDDHDKGGNDKKVKSAQLPDGSLHYYWDTVLVTRIANSPPAIARNLIRTIGANQVKAWSKGDAAAWAQESFEVSNARTYGGLGRPGVTGQYTLSDNYVRNGTNTCARQMARAGVRLARVLNEALE
jgi:hypothetical protein